MSVVALPEEKLDKYRGEEPHMNFSVLQKSTTEHRLCASVKPTLQRTAWTFWSLWEIHITELLASCPSLRTLCRFFSKRTSFQDQPPPQGWTLASTVRVPDSEETFPQTEKQSNTTELPTSQTFFPHGSWQIFSFASHPSWTKLLQRIPPVPLPPCNAIPREKWFHGDPLLSCIWFPS